jgi:cyclophilin family peptidyl-prolyl cis-trans isomerase
MIKTKRLVQILYPQARWEDMNKLKKVKLRLKALILMFFLSLQGLPLAYAVDPPFTLPSPSELAKLRSAYLETNKGNITFLLYPEHAPWHVANLKYLADKGFYRNKTFHLFYSGYIIQGGSPSTDPNAGPGYTLPPEFNQLRHEFGILGMARKMDSLNPERRSHGSQFHIILGEAPHLDGSFTIFGKAVDGLDVLPKLQKGDRILNFTVYVREPDEKKEQR